MIGYNSHGHFDRLEEILKIEKERDNYIDAELKAFALANRNSYMAIWVCLKPKYAVPYLRQAADHDLPVTKAEIKSLEKIDLSKGILWTAMDDGDEGYLFIILKGRL